MYADQQMFGMGGGEGNDITHTVMAFTLPETNSSPLKIGFPNRKVVFQPSIFRGYVSFRECMCDVSIFYTSIFQERLKIE